MTGLVRIAAVLAVAALASACAPEVGSDEWCQDMVDKPKGDWTANEAAEFAKSCIFESYDEE
jgi:hypothetical protein